MIQVLASVVIASLLTGSSYKVFSAHAYTVKIAVYHGYFVPNFPYFKGTGSVYVCLYGPALHYSVDLRFR